VVQPNILLTLTQEAYNSFSALIRPWGLLLSDPRFVRTTKKADAKKLELPMYEQVMEKIGKPIVYNICTLGMLIGITQLIPVEAVIQVLEKRIPKDFLAMNHRALDIGLVLGSQYQYKVLN
jgi:2-oxoglutarate ferredoxin oxidoreductase subunit gamma